MSIRLKLVDTNSQISKDINIAIANEVNKIFKRRKTRIENNIKKLIPGWIIEQPEIASLNAEGVKGSLNAEFGLYPGTASSAVTAINLAVRESVSVSVEPLDKNLQGGIVIQIQPESFANLLGLSEGFVITPTANLHWLDWILTQGDRVIVVGYYYQPSNEGRGRAGTMEIGQSWRVDPRYAGTIENNFITRALEGREKEISSALEKAIK